MSEQQQLGTMTTKMLQCCYIVAAVASLLVSVNALQCIGQNGQEVDWWLVLKYPMGYQSTYLDADGVALCDNGSCWSSNFDVRADNAVTKTVRLLDKAGTGFVFYNDEDPTTGQEMWRNAHAKGVVIFDQQSGIWIVHSAPKYPARLVDANWWELRPPQSRFGQHFACVSLTANSTDTLGRILSLRQVYMYDNSDMSEQLKDLYPNLDQLLTNPSFVAPSLLKSKDALRTIAGLELTSFSKAQSPRNPLHIHEDFIEAAYKTPMLWETWRPGGEPTFCPEQGYPSYNNKQIKVPENRVGWHTFDDHSKWGVSLDSNVPVTCFGDLNRAESQAKRGGGYLCWTNSSVWNAVRKLVVDYESCKASTAMKL